MKEFLKKIWHLIKTTYRRLKKFVSRIVKAVTHTEKISIAVVGITSSGKSYLLSDIIPALNSMRFNVRDMNTADYPHRSFNDYKAKISENGNIEQTIMYACRPGKNIYGAVLEGNGQKLEIEFVDIPGEVFGSDAVNTNNDNSRRSSNRFLQIYHSYSRSLRENKKKNFTVVPWENSVGIKYLVVEPRNMSQEVLRQKEASQKSKEAFEENMSTSFQDWGTVFGWLKAGKFKEEREDSMDITGKELLEDFFTFQPDTLMLSLAAVFGESEINIDGISTADDFRNNNIREAFYFLHYCANASDIIICDKLLEPTKDGGSQLLNDENNIHTTLLNNLQSFVQNERANTYYAFRGVDFMLQKKAKLYEELKKDIVKEEREHNSPNIENNVRNKIYSIFSYLLWKHISPEMNTIEDEETLKEYLGMTDSHIDLDYEKLEENYIDFSCGNEKESIRIEDAITPVTGDNNSFRSILNASYGTINLDPDLRMQSVTPHTYFTATPITLDFNIYKNDPEHHYTRFVDESRTGKLKYFDSADSRFCFGSFQLCCDIMKHHSINIDDIANRGELLNITMQP